MYVIIIRPYFKVVKEGWIFLTEKMSWKYSSPLQEHHLKKIDDVNYRRLTDYSKFLSCSLIVLLLMTQLLKVPTHCK